MTDEPGSRDVSSDDELRVLGRYQLRFRVADGGMGSVYLAQLMGEQGFQKWLAIKTVHKHVAREPKFIQMFLNEARLAARIDHPNVCSVFDFGEADGMYYLAMEYLHGEALNRVVRRAWQRGGFPYHIAARIVADAARGLHAAHELRRDDGTLADVVHRDVSPQNIFVLYSGVAKVVDFGIARSNEHLGERTATGEIKGKLGYMSPEQLEADSRIDRRTDVWALGVVLWEATTGARLFKRDSDARTIMAVARAEIPLPSTKRPDYPKALEAVVMRALARDPNERYATAGEMTRDLEAYLAGCGEPTSPDDVGAFARGLCEDLQIAREEMLRRDASSSAVKAFPTTSTPSELEPRINGGRTATGSVSREIDVARERGTRTRTPVVVGLVLLGVGALGGASLWLANHGRVAPAQRAQTAAPHAAASFASIAAPPPAPVPPAAPPAPVQPISPQPTIAPPVAPRATSNAPPAPHHATALDTDPGYLSLFAVPSAQVFDNGASLGYTPIARHSMRSGRHVLRLVPSDGSAARNLPVRITPGETTTESLRFH